MKKEKHKFILFASFLGNHHAVGGHSFSLPVGLLLCLLGLLPGSVTVQMSEWGRGLLHHLLPQLRRHTMVPISGAGGPPGGRVLVPTLKKVLSKLIIFVVVAFSLNRPLGRFSLEVAMSVCLWNVCLSPLCNLLTERNGDFWSKRVFLQVLS